MTLLSAPGVDAGSAVPVRIGRLVLVEMHKCVDTRGARAVLLTFAGVGVAALVATLALAPAPTAEIAALPAVLLSIAMPVVGILTMTSEWSQRTALTTFWLAPRRSRVLTAKSLAALAVGTLLLTAAFAVFSAVTWLVLTVRGLHVDAGALLESGRMVASMGVFGVLFGLAWGALVMSTAPAVVVVVVAPLVVDTTVGLMAPQVAPWVGTATAQNLLSGSPAPAAAAVTSTLLWYVLPLVIGWALQVRREVR